MTNPQAKQIKNRPVRIFKVFTPMTQSNKKHKIIILLITSLTFCKMIINLIYIEMLLSKITVSYIPYTRLRVILYLIFDVLVF